MSLFQGHYACRKVTQPHRHYNIPSAVHQMTYTRVLLLWEDPALSHSCSLLMKTKKVKTAVYGFLDSRSLCLLQSCWIKCNVSYQPIHTAIWLGCIFCCGAVYTFHLTFHNFQKLNAGKKILIGLNKKFLENSNRMTPCLCLTIKQLF